MLEGTYKTVEYQLTKGENLPIETKHEIFDTEKELIVKIEIKIDKRRSDYSKIKNKTVEKQTSPAIDIIRNIEKNRRADLKEGRGAPLYKDIL